MSARENTPCLACGRPFAIREPRVRIQLFDNNSYDIKRLGRLHVECWRAIEAAFPALRQIFTEAR